ncbi:secreted protein [Candidatus Magnetoovum chiemensis]|nr:secreted protein [Candidatus Magnetoovum chiemensis]
MKKRLSLSKKTIGLIPCALSLSLSISNVIDTFELKAYDILKPHSKPKHRS